MLTYIGIISLVILIIAIYQYRKEVVVEDNLETFSSYNWRMRYNGIPRNYKKNTMYLRVFADDYLHIYLNKGSREEGIVGRSPWRNTKWIGQARCCGRVYLFEVDNFNYGDSLMFYSYNSGGPGYWGGLGFMNGKWYPFNKSTVKISSYQTNGDIYRKSGKYLGCYKDGYNRRLPYYYWWRGSFETCQQAAAYRNHRYFGTQHGGWCSTGKDLRKAKSYGRVSDRLCANQWSGYRNWNPYIRWTQTYGLGGPWTNALYDATQPPEIEYYGYFGYRWMYSPNARRWIYMPIGGLYGMKPKNAGHGRQHSLWRWVQFQFKSPAVPVKLEFCPDSRYTEFNSAGCSDPTSTQSCIKTTYPNYQAKMSECHNIYNVEGNNFDNKDFYSAVQDAIDVVRKNPRKLKYLTGRFKNSFLSVNNLCCKILGNLNNKNVSRFDTKKCQQDGNALNISHLNHVLKLARENSDKHAMKDGKTGNTFLRGQLDYEMHELLARAREVVGQYQEECKCKKFSNTRGPTCKPC